MPLNIDFEFISKLEGGCKIQGYVPDENNSKSGVTIATGFDLGARNHHDLASIGFGPDLIARFTPYLGLKTSAAQAALRKAPLKITSSECVMIDGLVKSHFTSQVMNTYNAYVASDKTRFEDLHPAIQTVIMSVAFQYGSNLPRRTPKFWGAVTTQNWQLALKILRNFEDKYPTRRKIEAKLLESAL